MQKEEYLRMDLSEPEHHAEDLSHKYIAAHFGQETVDHFQIPQKIVRVAPTNQVAVQMKEMYEDFCYLMENGEWHHFEFESDDITLDDMRRFREYESVTSRTYKVPVVTHVICSADVKLSRAVIREGINSYRVKLHRHKRRSANRLFVRMKKKDKKEITREDLVMVVFSPLMGGKMSKKERVLRGLQILNEEYEQFSKEDLKKMQATLYVLASKFLMKNEMKEVKEGFFMNPLGQMIFDDGVVVGRKEGRSEGISVGICRGRAACVVDLLQGRGTVVPGLSEKIMNEKDAAVLKDWLMLAANCRSVQEFEAAM